MHKNLRKILAALATLAAALILALAILVSLARFFMPSIEQYEGQIGDLIADYLPVDIEFSGMEVGWYRFGPAIRVNDIVLKTQAGETITEIAALYVRFSVFASVRERLPVPVCFTVVGLDLDIQALPQGGFEILGWPEQTSDSEVTLALITEGLNRYRYIALRRSRVDFLPLQGEPINMEVDHVIMTRKGRTHHIDAELALIDQPTTLAVLAEVKGDITVPADLEISAHMHVQQADLKGYLQDLAILGYHIEEGHIDALGWLDWQQGRLTQAHTLLDVRQLSLRSEADDAAFEPLNVSGQINWENPEHNTWTLSGQDIFLGFAKGRLAPLISGFKMARTDEHAGVFVADDLKLSQLSAGLLFSQQLSGSQQILLDSLAVQGQLNDIKYTWQADDWQLGLRFEQLAYQASDNIPGVSGMGGEIKAQKGAGQLSVYAEDATVDATSMFPEVFTFSDLQGDVRWIYDEDSWQIRSDDLLLVDENMRAQADVYLQGEGSELSFVDIQANTADVDARAAYQYIPEARLSPRLVDWLNASIGPGLVTEAQLRWQGAPAGFPFYDAGDGLFSLRFSAEDLTLQYQPDWPALTDITGDMLLAGRRLQVVTQSASVCGVPVLAGSADVSLPAEGTKWLNAHGEAITPAQNGIHFLQQTPLWDTLGASIEPLTIDAASTMVLDLAIPLNDSEALTQIDGAVQVSEGDVRIDDWRLHFTDVNGVMAFTRNSLSTTGIKANLFDKPVELTVTPHEVSGQTQSQWLLSGRYTVDDLNNYLPLKLWSFAEGESDFAAGFTTSGDTHAQGLDLVIASDLQGIALDLPVPLGKDAQTATDLRYTYYVDGDDVTKMRVQYADTVDAVIGLAITEGEADLTGAQIRLSGALNDLTLPNGINISGYLPSFSLDVWREFFEAHQQPSEQAQSRSLANDLNQVDVAIDNLTVFNHLLTNTRVKLSQPSGEWFVELSSDDWAGQIAIPQAGHDAPLELIFSRCVWQDSDRPRIEIDIDPRELPAFTFSCDRFTYNDTLLGEVRMTAVAESSGLRFSELSLVSNIDSVDASGRWWMTPEGVERTRMAGRLRSSALDKTLDVLDINSSIRDSDTRIDFVLYWPGSPADIGMDKLSGEMDIRLRDGVLVDVDPGFGRLLSLISVQALQRRLRLDFSDVFSSGFSFDELTAFITLDAGKARSDDLTLKAPAAEVKMRGEVDLATEQLDLMVNITAHISATLPLAATIASGGNPIVGAIGVGVWAFDKIISSQGDGIISSRYQVSGTWEDPVITDM